jgi:hypothetical protein
VLLQGGIPPQRRHIIVNLRGANSGYIFIPCAERERFATIVHLKLAG